MRRGYYIDRDSFGQVVEVTFVSGKATGNCYYNPWADEPRWAGILQEYLEPVSGEHSLTPPEGIPRAPQDK
jgi:hypothetical protein